MSRFRLKVLCASILFMFCNVAHADDKPCFAMPLAYGPECVSSGFVLGSVSMMITYTISEIALDTNIKCMGQGFGNTYSCDKKEWGWYDLGVLKDGDESTIYWGANDASPAIKCQGLPLSTGIKWTYGTFVKEKVCCDEKYDPNTQICCTPFQFNAYPQNQTHHRSNPFSSKDKLKNQPHHICPKAKNTLCCGPLCWDSTKKRCCSSNDETFAFGLCPLESECCGANLCYTNGTCCQNWIQFEKHLYIDYKLCSGKEVCATGGEFGMKCCPAGTEDACIVNGEVACVPPGSSCCKQEFDSDGGHGNVICPPGGICCGWRAAPRFCCPAGNYCGSDNLCHSPSEQVIP